MEDLGELDILAKLEDWSGNNLEKEVEVPDLRTVYT